MEKKNNGTLVGILIGIIIMLLVVGCLFATGIISFKTSTTTNNEQTTENNQTNDNNTSNEIDSAIINNLYSIIGINLGSDKQYWGDCINYYLSNNNYKENAKKIFGLYASYNNLNTNHYNDGSCNDECKRVLSCGECSSIKKINADKITKLYSLDNLKFNELPGFEEEYAYTNGIPAGVCHYKVTHDTSSEYVDSSTIRIIDKQETKDYEFGEEDKINNTKNQIVTYEFKKDGEGNYYLSQVTVK